MQARERLRRRRGPLRAAGPRATRGRACAAALAALACAALPAGAARAEDGTAGLLPERLVAAGDGAMWLLDRRAGMRVLPGGRRESLDAIGAGRWWWQSAPTPLADGSVGIVQEGYDRNGTVRALVRVRAGRAAGMVTMPARPSWDADLTVAPDGSVWRARSCSDRLLRVAPSGRVQRIRLRPLGCRHVDEWIQPENAQALRAGTDGSMWLVNGCQGRIVRVDWRLRVREWTHPPACREDGGNRVVPTPVRAEPRGGVRTPGARVTARGQLRTSPSITVPDAVTADGSEWRVDGAAVLRRTPDGAEQRVPLGDESGPLYAQAVAEGPDGRLWFVATRDAQTRRFDAPPPVVGTVDGAGGVDRRRFSAAPDRPPEWGYRPLLAAGPERRMWVADVRRAPAGSQGRGALLTELSTGDPVPATRRASAARVLDRARTRVLVQVACQAPAGEHCRGRVGLATRDGRALARPAGRFAVAGGSRGVTVLRLTRRARAATRRRSLRARATVRGNVPRARQAVRVPRWRAGREARR